MSFCGQKLCFCGPRDSKSKHDGGPCWSPTFCPIPVFMKPKGFKLRRQSMLLEKCSKRGDLRTSQNSENGGPVQAGAQLTVMGR